MLTSVRFAITYLIRLTLQPLKHSVDAVCCGSLVQRNVQFNRFYYSLTQRTLALSWTPLMNVLD